jgi:sodium transport system ATP-binding protein
MTADGLSGAAPAAPTDSAAGPAVLTRDLRKVYAAPKRGEVQALAGLELRCDYGEIYGLLGPNGAGKSTCLRILATMLAPTAGTAQVAGFDVVAQPLEVRRHIGFLSATTGLYPRLDVRETLEYFGRLHGLRGPDLSRRVDELIATFRMESFATRRCEHLSSGQKQRLSIARAVLHDPPVLILDEPTTGLDILSTGDMIEFIAGRRAARRCVLFSTHVLSEAERLCNRIGIIHRGRLLGSGTLDELRRSTGATYLDDIFKTFVRREEESQPV